MSQDNRPLHERIKPLGWIRNPLRNALFGLIQDVFQTEDGRAIAAGSLHGLLHWQPGMALIPADGSQPPYPDLGRPRLEKLTGLRTDVVFITARFRTGSTLLWNLFRNIEGITSYYEPFNERRWFDPAVRGEKMDGSHRNVSAYWWEYDKLEELGEYFRDDWAYRNLFMDDTAWEPDMKRYVELLIEKAPGRPVLQFNRIDFRLPWFRRNFPGAKIVHLYRHPRDQWCSALVDVQCFPKDGRVEDFTLHDRFYLLPWARDLQYHFPFLNVKSVSHPYELFYYLWKLSYLFGLRYAHFTLAFEDLVKDPVGKLKQLFEVLGVGNYDLERLNGLLVKPAQQKWKAYAEEEWFLRHEENCETVLAEFFQASACPS
jgi:hypothetical protein